MSYYIPQYNNDNSLDISWNITKLSTVTVTALYMRLLLINSNWHLHMVSRSLTDTKKINLSTLSRNTIISMIKNPVLIPAGAIYGYVLHRKKSLL